MGSVCVCVCVGMQVYTYMTSQRLYSVHSLHFTSNETEDQENVCFFFKLYDSETYPINIVLKFLLNT